MQLSRMSYQKLTDFLAGYYGVDLYTHHDLEHPVLFYPAARSQQDDVDSVLGTPPSQVLARDDLYIYDEDYLDTLREGNAHLFNGTTFAMERIRTQPLHIDGVLGKYYDTLATCYALETELLEALDTTLDRLPIRARLHRALPARECLTSGAGRSAAIGGAGLVIFNDGRQYQAILSQRTRRHATRPDSYHVLPAFIFQPVSASGRESEWSIRHHFYREWLEELFGMDESGAVDIYRHPALVDLLTMQANQQAGLYLSGVAVNLLTLRPEICLVLVIHDPGWWHRVNAPDSAYQIVTPEARGNIIRAPIATDEGLLDALPERDITRFVPQAIPALWEGVAIARERIGFLNDTIQARGEEIN